MIGETISHFRITEKLGEGGMGVVYKAEDSRLGRPVALKFISPELTRDDEAKTRFVQEARAASALDHPNICTIHGIDETDDGRLFICMACYEGETAKQAVARGPLPIKEVVDFAIQVAEGLGKAHSLGIVHRDIKPGNIFITRDGRAKILDFGLAKLAGQSRLTQEGGVVGTAAYMSPEQLQGAGLDQRTDIWSLGVVLFEMLTGQLPFQADYAPAMLYSICNDEPGPIASLRGDSPPMLEAIVERCLKKNPDKRYQSTDELTVDLRNLKAVAGLESSSTSTAALPVRTTMRRLRIIVPVAVLAVAAVLLINPSSRHFVFGPFAGRVSARKQVTVLPFAATGATTADRLFFDGLAEYLTFRLCELEQYDDALLVFPASEMRGDITTPRGAREVSGATHAIVGEVAREGDLIGLDLDLVDTATLESTGSWATTERMGNVSALQHRLVFRLAELLEIDLEPDAMSVLSEGGTTVPGAHDAYLKGLGHLQGRGGNEAASTDSAIVLFERAITADPSFTLAHAALGGALWHKCRATNDPQCSIDAVASLERAVRLEGPPASARVTLGIIHRSGGEYDKAIEEFREALTLDPANLQANRQLAATYDDMGDAHRAELAYKRLIDLRPEHWIPHTDLGIFYRCQGRYEEAAAEFQKVIELVPGNVWGYRNLGVVYFELDRHDEALPLLERANEISPSSAGYSNLATFYYMDGRYVDAARMYEAALALDDSRYSLWGNLGAAYLWVPGGHEKALAAYREAVERAEDARKIQKRDATLVCLLGGYSAELDLPDTARALSEQALSWAPNDIEIVFQAGHNYEVLGDRELAVELIGKALEGGYSRDQVERTPGLRGLCTDPEFRRLTEQTDGRS